MATGCPPALPGSLLSHIQYSQFLRPSAQLPSQAWEHAHLCPRFLAKPAAANQARVMDQTCPATLEITLG